MERDIAIKYNAYETSKGNIIWCGTMALAWHQLARQHGLKQLHLNIKKQLAKQIVQNYNKSAFLGKDISERSIYIKCGYGPQTVDLINKEVKQKFPQMSYPDLKIKMAKSDIIAYAYLFKQLQFERKFTIRKNKTFKFNGKPVKSFYADAEQQKKQIKVHHYQNKNNFMISIGDRLTNDVMYLLKNDEELTVDEVTDKIMKGQKKGSVSIRKHDLFQMPVIELDCSRSVRQLIGAAFLDAPLKQYQISMMFEAMKLKVNESGAKLESLAVIKSTKAKISQPQPPRQFILDKTFWFVMAQINQHPYVCVQINEASDINQDLI